ncbi:MAG: hypothetical protein R3199_08695 [Gemmatimonadota bacterium]|nr:hypothetical protein [Gemmatimonadota bacterium]
MIDPPPVPACLLPVAFLALLGACGGDRPAGEGEAPVNDTLGEEPASGQAVSSDPRFLLFDIQTALESAHAADGEYPSVGEFTLRDRWRTMNTALDVAFDEWSYYSDGESYTLVAERGGRHLEISSPEGAPADSPPGG